MKSMTKKILIPVLALAMLMTVLPVDLASLDAATSQRIEDVQVRESSTQAIITWETRKKSDITLYYGTNPNFYEVTVVSPYSTRDHRVVLKALDPETTYYFMIVAGDETYEDRFETVGNRPNLIVYQSYFTLLFEDAWKNINGKSPSVIGDPDGLNFNRSGFNGNALKVDRPASYLQYSCDNDVFNAGFGTVSAWVSFDRFDKSAVIWQTNDSRYALYYEVGGANDDFDKRIVARAGGNVDGEYPEAEYIIDPDGSRLNKWRTNEWHFLTMTWEGKFKGKVRLFIDGRRVDEAQYEDGTGCSSFRIGNNYREDNMFFNIGKLDEVKVHQWAMNNYYVNNTYSAYKNSPNFGKGGSPESGSVAGYMVRNFRNGDLMKAPDGKIYVLSRGKKIHIDGSRVLNRYGSHPIINVSWDEIGQYEDGGSFFTWSRFPDGTLLKAEGDSDVYWVWNGKKGLIENEEVFYRYGNKWENVVTISRAALSVYRVGPTYK